MEAPSLAAEFESMQSVTAMSACWGLQRVQDTPAQ